MNIKLVTRAATAAIAVALAAAPRPASPASDPAHERHELMEAVGDALKPLVAIAKKEAPFDAAVVQRNAGLIADHLEKAARLFPEGSADGSRAKPEIWSDRAGFDKALNDGIAAAKALRGAKDETAFAAAFPAVGASCKSCHDKYRAPKK